MNSYIKLIVLSTLIFASACVPESKKLLTEVDVQLKDPVYQRIFDNQYLENTDSLLIFLQDKNPTYRLLAAQAFGSHQDLGALDSLYTLLDDPIIKVRAMAAYSIGQIRKKESETFLLKGFRQRDTMSVDNSSNGSILQAVGKLGNPKMADLMISASGYRDSDTLLFEGRAKAIYEYGLNNIFSAEIIQFAVQTVRNYSLSQKTRLYAAHYLARTKNIDIDKVKFQIAEAFTLENNIDIKMALATALRNTNDKEIQSTLLSQLDLEQDYRIKCNIIRTLANYNYIESAEKITNLIKDDNIHIARAACEFLKNNGSKDDIIYYRQIAKDSLPWQVKSDLFEAINTLLPYYFTKTINATRWQVTQEIEKSEDPLVQANYIRALGQDPGSYPFLIEFAEKSESSAVKTATITALGNILASENFNGTYQGFGRYHRRKILEYMMKGIDTNDEGIVGEAALAIANEKTGLKELIDSTEFLFKAKSALNNPGQIESIHNLDRAIATMRGVTNANLTEIANHKLPQWNLLYEYDESTTAIVKTNKGVFKIKLFFKDAPGSVLNFLKLSLDDFYDDKIFHRVVPNFVIQTGSPRADNYGGKDYAIRSDLGPLNYDSTGYVGMASAGQDSESTQWFVTHSPAPHLSGKYSIFGKIVEGMDVVHNIQVGDKILDIIITNI